MVTIVNKSSFPRKLLIIAALLAYALFVSGCQPTERKRPYGVVTLGKIDELKRPESYLSAQGLLLRFDEKGFSVMSLLCTYDLAPLKVRQQGDRQILISPYSPSTYNLDGSILTGPTQHPLPYYEIIADAGKYGGPVDTLFAKIGTVKPSSWRLAVP